MIELAVDQSVEQVLNRGFYVIPRFQRPYSWTADNVGDFWADTIQFDASEYFIGSVIVYEYGDPSEQRRQSPEYAVVDGQQRLTTITILLAAVRDALLDVAESAERETHQTLREECRELASGVQSFIQRGDRRARQRRVLTSETGYPYLQTYVQSIDHPEPERAPVRPDERRIETAYKYFGSQLSDLVDASLRDPTVPDESRLRAVVERLEEIRDKILNLTVILVVVDNEDDAYEIFETLNTRGQDLNLADLVRNFLLRDLREETEGVDTAKTRYSALLEDLHDPEAPIEPAQFLLHSWLSRRDYTSGKKLFRDIKQKVQGPRAKKDFLSDLEVDLPIYRRARYPRATPWGQMADVGRSIDALVVFRMMQPLPLVLSALRAHNERRLTAKNLRKLLRAIESFHFRYTAVAGRSSSGGISKRYASVARRLTEASQSTSADVVRDLVDRLRESVPSDREFDAGFSELRFWSGYVGQKQLIQYILRRLYEHHSEGSVSVDFDSMTIEHLAPERSAAGGDQMEPSAFGAVGNLVLISGPLNARLANKPWHEKIEILRSQQEIWIPPDVLAADRWDEEAIAERTMRLSSVSQADVWRL